MLLALAMVDARAGFLLLREKGQRQLSLAQKTNLDDAQLDLLLEGPLGEKFKKAMRTGATLRMDSTELPAALKSEYLVVIPVGDTGLLGVIDKETRSDYHRPSTKPTSTSWNWPATRPVLLWLTHGCTAASPKKKTWSRASSAALATASYPPI